MTALDDPRMVRASDLRTKREILRVFLAHWSPRIILLTTTVTLVARLSVWSVSRGDLVVLAAVLFLTGPLEWFIHKFALHTDPDAWLTRKLGLGVGHRNHHVDPPALDNLLLAGPDAAIFCVVLGLTTTVWALPLLWLTGSPIAVPMLTALALTYLGFANYEWTHLMVHTRYRPRTRFYARLARNHRLHHYRNEEYWLGVTSNLGDRLLRTYPRHKTDVPLSDTARNLDG